VSRLVKVKVSWSQDKLRRPSGTTYSTVARFAEDIGWPNGDAWSVVLEFVPGEALHPDFYGMARFLVPEAPQDRLRSGSSFELYEGDKVAARVMVL